LPAAALGSSGAAPPLLPPLGVDFFRGFSGEKFCFDDGENIFDERAWPGSKRRQLDRRPQTPNKIVKADQRDVL
jgi:hypothetical protein